MGDAAALDFRVLRIFVLLIDLRSLSAVAEHLQISQSAVSQSLARLRAHFGDQLFTRTARGVAPTDRALEIAPRARQLLADFQELNASFRAFDAATTTRTFTISVPDGGELFLAPPILSRLQREAPNARLRILKLDGLELEHRLESGEVDLALDGRARFGDGIIQRKVCSHELVLVGHAASFETGVITRDRYDEASHVSILASRLQFSDIADALRLSDMEVDPVLLTPHASLIAPVIAANPNIVAYLPRSLFELFQESCSLKKLKPLFPIPESFDIYMYWHRLHANDPVKTWLRLLVRTALARSPEPEAAANPSN